MNSCKLYVDLSTLLIGNRPTLTYAHTPKETELRATQYLPDIARLQQCLYDKFNQQIYRKDVKKQTIQAFIKELPNGIYIDMLKFGF